jgi:DNA-binding NarL/FixJ family response regulator
MTNASDDAVRGADRGGTARILIIEDHPIVRFGLAQLVVSTQQFAVVGAVGTQSEARAMLREHPVDLLLLDLMLGAVDTLAFMAELAQRHREVRILVISAMQESVYAERALRAGALGYVMKSADMSEVLLAINSVLQGRVYLSPKIFVTLFRGLLQRSSVGAVPGAEGLSDRELQVFQLIGAGTANREIAKQLGISVKTVETHRENLKNKLGIANAADLAAAAQRFVGSMIG